MKSPHVALAFGCLILLAGCQSAQSPTAASASSFKRQEFPEKTLNELIRRVRNDLPKGWTVSYDKEYQWLEIERNAPTAMNHFMPSMPAPMPGEKIKDEEPSKPSFAFRIVSFVAPADWASKRAGIQHQMTTLEGDLYPNQAGKGWPGDLFPRTEAEKPKTEEYNRLFHDLGDMPDFHYKDISLGLWLFSGLFKPFEYVEDETVRNECKQVFARFTALLTKYESAHGGLPYHDIAYAGGPQKIPGAVFCAYYDEGGEGVAYHDSDAVNQGSGKLNPADGTYLNEFRRHEGLDISYTKQVPDRESPCNKVVPPLGLLYVGWNEPGEWFNLTVETAEAGFYVADLLYTAQRDATVSISVQGDQVGRPFPVASTFDAAETIPWRQWHHWNVARDTCRISLPKGVCVLRVRIVTGGNINLATLIFRRVGAARTEPDIVAFKTAAP